jgi:hypothetical protein
MTYLKHAGACMSLVLSVAVLTGCASTPSAEGEKSSARSSDPDDKSYLTGSRIPRKTNAESITKVSKEAFAESMRERPQGMGAGQ